MSRAAPHTRSCPRFGLLAVGVLLQAGCPNEDFVIVEPAPPDFVQDASIAFDTSSPGIEVVSGVEYVPTVRDLLVRCAACHGDDGPIEPPLHTYVTARNGLNDMLRALDRGHDGDYTRLSDPCGIVTGSSSEDHDARFVPTLVETLRGWQAGGFRPGPPPTPKDPVTLPPPDASFSIAPIASASPRCHRLGDLGGRVTRMRFDAHGLAWVEIFAVAPPIAKLLSDLEAADAAPGWDCDDALGLVPQPLVGAWQLGDADLDLTSLPVHIPPSTLVARVHGSFLPTPLEGPSLTLSLWTTPTPQAAMTFFPLTASSRIQLPWFAPSDRDNRVTAIYSTASTGALDLRPSPCLQERREPAVWPELQLLPPPDDVPVPEMARIELACSQGSPCAAQLAVLGDLEPEPCDTTAARCHAACDGDLACLWPCTASTGGRCPTCVIVGQLACRSEPCTTTARDRLESCAGAHDPTMCIASSVLDALVACPSTDLCRPALDACFHAE